MPEISGPVVLLTEALQYPTVEFYDYDEEVSIISQPSGRHIDARDERLHQVSLSEGLLWTSAPLPADFTRVSCMTAFTPAYLPAIGAPHQRHKRAPAPSVSLSGAALVKCALVRWLNSEASSCQLHVCSQAISRPSGH